MRSDLPVQATAHLLDRLGEQLLTWATTNGIAVLATIAVATVVLHLGTAVIDRIQGSLQEAPTSNARRVQRTLTLTAILRSTLKTVILFAATLSLLSSVGINITPILASAGVVGLAVGFGAQSLVKDVIAGFFIIFEDQYGVGDLVEIEGKSGLVERMNLRITQLRGAGGELVTLPNGAVHIVSNLSKEWARAVLDIGVAYHADLDRALEVMVGEGEQLRGEWSDQILEAPEVLGVQAFGDSNVHLKVTMKTAPLKQGAVACEWRRRVKQAFDREGIAISLPQRELRIVSDVSGATERPSAPSRD